MKIRRAAGKRAGPVVHLPASLIAGSLGFLEKWCLPLLPFTAGQIASFLNDGTAEPDAEVSAWQVRMAGVERMIAAGNPA